MPDVEGCSVGGKVLDIRFDPNGVAELDEYIVEVSSTVVGVYRTGQLLLLSRSSEQSIELANQERLTIRDLSKLSRQQLMELVMQFEMVSAGNNHRRSRNQGQDER
jgi:hypothetical protein